MNLALPDIQQALVRIQEHLQPTPLVLCDKLKKELNFPGNIFVKCENEQPTGTFKVRGAFNAIMQLSSEEREKGVVTRSSGNFAQAVAFAAEKLHLAATIIMPSNAPKIKVEGTEKFHPIILFSGEKHEEGEAIVKQLVEKKGYIPLHPYNNYRTMAGQGTAALEILTQLSKVDHFFCPIGGGGLLSGCSTVFKESGSDAIIHGVEPAGAGDYYASRQSGQRECWEHVNTIADGLRASSVGELNYPILNKYVDEVSVVTDEEIKKAMKWLYEKMNMVVEPSGAVSLAGFLNKYQELKGNVVILISGQNVDPESFEKWVNLSNS